MRKRRDAFWRLTRKWCFLGALGVLIWLLVPVGKCAYQEFAGTEVGEMDEDNREVWDSDQTRVAETGGFFSRVFGSIGVCYDRFPLKHHEEWKRNLLYGLGAGFLLSWMLVIVFKPRYSR